MRQTIETIFSATGAFGATNLDDLFVLMLFFSQTNRHFTNTHVIIGQYLGICSLIIMSLMGVLGTWLIPQSYIGLLGIIPLYIGIRQWLGNRKEAGGKEGIQREQKDHITIEKSERSNMLKVAVITVANGGDNISIYIPVFASQTMGQLFITIFTFLVMVGLWCYGGMKLARHPKMAAMIEKRGEKMVPWVFIALGVYILLESGSLRYIFNAF